MSELTVVSFSPEEVAGATCISDIFIAGADARIAAGRLLQNGSYECPHDAMSMEGKAFAAGWAYQCDVYAGAQFPSDLIGAFVPGEDEVRIYFGLLPEPPCAIYAIDHTRSSCPAYLAA